jgi:N-formylglutamate amidohydrolase
MAELPSPFVRLGPDTPQNPIILSVPHAGRKYPDDIDRLIRPSTSRLSTLEDRYADLLIQSAAAAGFSTIVAKTPRLWIDLNRSELDVDPDMIATPIALRQPMSSKARGGLGLIPRRTPALGDLWIGRLTEADLVERINVHHRPYHAALQAMIEAATARFGSTILLDIHSMPPLPPERGRIQPKIVVGDRFGRSADHWVSDRAHEVFADHGYRTAANAPYAGGHILERHASPQNGVHAIQIEIDRSLYLDGLLDRAGLGLSVMQGLILDLAETLSSDLASGAMAIAAE